ncbi:MAG TPA: hypothetical protein VK983_01035 [Candidatus Limnocylindrales bacterium]|nr:hypothetical protein [Candidatus Limnocylindrales bacterium]
MLKYFLIIIINLPIILFGLSRVYKLFRKGDLTSKELAFWVLLWSVFLAVLFLIIPLEGMAVRLLYADRQVAIPGPSAFDVIEITFLTVLIYLLYRQGAKITYLQQKLAKVNRAVALRDAEGERR